MRNEKTPQPLTPENLCGEATSGVKRLLEPHGFFEKSIHSGTMGGWFLELETSEFITQVEQERSGSTVGIYIGSKIRRKPRAHMRGPWSLHHLRGYLEGGPDHYTFKDLNEQLDWLAAHVDQILDTSFLNSDDLSKWSVRASRRMFGHI